MKYFLIILFILFAGVGCQKSLIAPTNINTEQNSRIIQGEISALEEELQKAIDAGGGINTVRYDQIIIQLKNIENRGASREMINNINLLLSKLHVDVGIPEQNVQQTTKQIIINPQEKASSTVNLVVVPPMVENISSVIETPKIPPPPNDEKKIDRLVLNNIGINLELYNPVTNMAGDILFTKNIESHYYKKSLLEFGATLTGPGGTDIMPHPTYILPLGTKLFSPVNGRVETIRYQAENNDYEIVIVPDDFSKWRISFDHIINLLFKQGDLVQVNDIVAEVAPSQSSAIPFNFGLVEFQVWLENNSFFNRGPGEATCPFLLLSDNTKQSIATKITQLAVEWEKYIDEDVYDEEKWVFPGCLLEKAQP